MIKFWKSINALIQKKSVTKDSHIDDFIIKYRHNNKDKEDDIDIQLLDQRRLVFISLIGLYQSWKKCPSIKLYSALLIIPLKRCWIYAPLKHVRELQTHLISIFSDVEATAEFIDFLKWKDKQNLVLWTLDYDKTSSESVELIHPFWKCLSDKLCDLYDPITRTKYNPIDLDFTFWQNKFNEEMLKYVPILIELHALTQKYDRMTEIILHSNPDSLLPIVNYETIDEIPIATTTTNNNLFDDYFDSSENENDWRISDEYDPYYMKDDTPVKL